MVLNLLVLVVYVSILAVFWFMGFWLEVLIFCILAVLLEGVLYMRDASKRRAERLAELEKQLVEFFDEGNQR